MSVARFSEPDEEEARRRAIEQFLLRTSTEVAQMRDSVPQLEKGDQACWQELRFLSHTIAATAAKFEVGIISACAKENRKTRRGKIRRRDSRRFLHALHNECN